MVSLVTALGKSGFVRTDEVPNSVPFSYDEHGHVYDSEGKPWKEAHPCPTADNLGAMVRLFSLKSTVGQVGVEIH